LSNSLR